MIDKTLKLIAGALGVVIGLLLVIATGLLAGMLALGITVLRSAQPGVARLPRRRAKPRPAVVAEPSAALAGKGSAA